MEIFSITYLTNSKSIKVTYDDDSVKEFTNKDLIAFVKETGRIKDVEAIGWDVTATQQEVIDAVIKEREEAEAKLLQDIEDAKLAQEAESKAALQKQIDDAVQAALAKSK